MAEDDGFFCLGQDRHAAAKGFADPVSPQTGSVLWEAITPVGLFPYSVRWDNCPFLDLLFLSAGRGHKGCGLQRETELKAQGDQLLLSIRVDESAQNFDRKLGSVDCEGIVFDHTSLEQPLELLMWKAIQPVRSIFRFAIDIEHLFL